VRNTIKQHKDFLIPDDAPRFVTDFFIVKSRPTKWPNDARYGLTATKRTFKLAHDRNRAKRLVRAWLRECESLMSPEMDYVFIMRAPILVAKKPDGIAQITRALKRLAIIGAPNPA